MKTIIGWRPKMLLLKVKVMKYTYQRVCWQNEEINTTFMSAQPATDLV